MNFLKMNNNVYDILKTITTHVLPPLAVLYGTLGRIWNLPYVEAIPLTITAIEVFMASLLGISSANYYKEQAESTAIVDVNEEDKG